MAGPRATETPAPKLMNSYDFWNLETRDRLFTSLTRESKHGCCSVYPPDMILSQCLVLMLQFHVIKKKKKSISPNKSWFVYSVHNANMIARIHTLLVLLRNPPELWGKKRSSKLQSCHLGWWNITIGAGYAGVSVTPSSKLTQLWMLWPILSHL